MSPQEYKIRCLEAAKEFNERANRNDGERITAGLNAGLDLLEDSIYLRLHYDVEQNIGLDSMTVPVSESKTRQLIKNEAEIYQIAESQTAVHNISLLGAADQWYWQWLARLRLGDSPIELKADGRIADYLAMTPHNRQLAFTNILVKYLPESNRAPLVLFQLFPLSVHIATVLAFGDNSAAATLREQEAICLPAINDCNLCRGRLLANGERCPKCGNPLWTHQWLAAD